MLDPKVKAALDAMEHDAPQAELAHLLQEGSPELLAAAVKAAQDHAKAFDTLLCHGGERRRLVGRSARAHDDEASSFATLRLRYSTLPYDAEAQLNQRIAVLRELQVRQTNFSAERLHLRSQRFFYGMLAAQAAVIIATFATAAHQRSLLWSLAAAAGVAAILFAAYVYLYI
jgi:hypothetical protein